MTSAFCWQNSVSLCPASFCTPRPNLPVTPDISWLPIFAFQSPIMERPSFFGVILKGLVGLHRTIHLQLLQHYWLGHRLGLLWYWMVCLGNEQRSFCHFWDCIQVSKRQWVNIDTDSKYAYLTLYAHAAIWKERQFKTATGEPIQHFTEIEKLSTANVVLKK